MERGVLLVVLVASVIATGPIGVPLARAESEAPAANPLSGNPAAISEGQSWFRAVCSFCHGLRAEGGRGGGPDLRGFDKGFRRYVETVKIGRDVPGRALKMPAWGGVLSDQQIYQIGAYLETLAKQGANWQ